MTKLPCGEKLKTCVSAQDQRHLDFPEIFRECWVRKYCHNKRVPLCSRTAVRTIYGSAWPVICKYSFYKERTSCGQERRYSSRLPTFCNWKDRVALSRNGDSKNISGFCRDICRTGGWFTEYGRDWEKLVSRANEKNRERG